MAESLIPEKQYDRLSKKELGYLLIAGAFAFFFCAISWLIGFGAHALSNTF